MDQVFSMGDQRLQKSYPIQKTRQTDKLPFSITGIGDFTCDNQYYTKRQGMEECLLLYCLEGQGIIQYEGKELLLDPGEVFVMDCRKFHYYATKNKKWHFIWFHFNGKSAFEFVDILNGEDSISLQIAGRIPMNQYFEKLISFSENFDLQIELEMSVLLQRVLTNLIAIKKKENFFGKYDRYEGDIQKCMKYIQENYEKKIQIHHLLDICPLSKYYFIKVFKAYVGQTPYEYILGIRLQNAQKFLLESDISVEEVGIQVGFPDGKNFIAFFKNKIGITPLQYRKQGQIR